MPTTTYQIKPIGQVKAGPEGFCLQIDPAYRAALQGLDGFSHANILWWSHYLDTPEYRSVTEAEQPYRNAPARLGIFATRSPVRPNPICLSAAQILGVDIEAGLVQLAYLDAEDGTPILDIKPYHPSVDRIRQVGLPAWCQGWPQYYEDSADFDWQSVFVNAQ